jgi:hypothetical protein
VRLLEVDVALKGQQGQSTGQYASQLEAFRGATQAASRRGRGRASSCFKGRLAQCHNHVDMPSDEFVDKRWKPFDVPFGPLKEHLVATAFFPT